MLTDILFRPSHVFRLLVLRHGSADEDGVGQHSVALFPALLHQVDGLQIVVHTQGPMVIRPRSYVLGNLIAQSHMHSHYCHKRRGCGGFRIRQDPSRSRRCRYGVADVADEAQGFIGGVWGELEHFAHFRLGTVEILP